MKYAKLAVLILLVSLFAILFKTTATATFTDLVIAWSNTIADEFALAYGKTFEVDMNAQQISKLTAEVEYSTANPTAASFTDGTPSYAKWTINNNNGLRPSRSSDTIRVDSNTALSVTGAYDYIDISSNGILNAATAYNTITVTSMSALTGSSITLSGTTFREGFEWRVMPTSAETTVNLSTALRTYGNGHEVQTATTSINVILLRLSTAGSFGNSGYWLATSSPEAYNLLSSTFIGGRDNAVFNLSGTSFTQGTDWTQNRFATNTANSMAAAVNASTYPVTARTDGGRVILETAGKGQPFNNLYSLTSSTQSALSVRWSHLSFGWAKAAKITLNGTDYVAGSHWRVGYTSTNTAQSIALALSSDTNVTATASSNTVTILSVSSGVAFNGYTLNVATFALASATGALVLGNTGYFVNGMDAAVFRINGWPFICDRDWFVGTTASGTAASLSDAIMGNHRVNTLVSSTWSTVGITYATSTLINKNDYMIFSSTNFALTLSSIAYLSVDSGAAVGFFSSGTASSISTATYYITTPSTFSLALGLLYTKEAGTNPTGLVPGTTYFATNVSGRTFQLAVTATSAVTGIPVAISSASPQGTSRFTLTPMPFQGPASVRFQVSNNHKTWFDIGGTSITLTVPTLTSATTFYDFGTVGARYVRVIQSTPTAGGTVLKVDVNGKR